MSSGVSVGARSNDSALENLAIILADPVSFQERINNLQKATLEASEAWARLRTAETAEAMMKDAEAKLFQANEKFATAQRDAESLLTSAKQEASEIVSAAKRDAESIVNDAKAEAAKVKDSAKKATELANDKVERASSVMAAAENRMSEALSLEVAARDKASQLTVVQAQLDEREKDLERKVTALASVASVLGIK